MCHKQQQRARPTAAQLAKIWQNMFHGLQGRGEDIENDPDFAL